MPFFVKGIKVCVVLLLSVFAVLHIPQVQTFIAKKIALVAGNAIGHKINIHSVNITWFDMITFDDIQIHHPNDSLPMIKIGQLQIDAKISTIWKKGQLLFDEVYLIDAQLNLQNDSLVNLNELIDKIKDKPTIDIPITQPEAITANTFVKKRSSKFIIDKLFLVHFKFSYHKKGQPILYPKIFDLHHFTFNDLNGEFNNFQIVNDTLMTEVKALNGKEHYSNLKLHHLRTNYLFCNNAMIFDDLEAAIGSSTLKDSLAFRYSDSKDLADFTEKVTVGARLKDSHLLMRDLGYFVDILQQYQDTLHLNMDLRGKIAHIDLTNLDLNFGDNSHIKGRASFRGLSKITETFVDLNFEESQVAAQDLAQYVPHREYSILKKFGDISFDAIFVGFFTDFATKGKFVTALGKLDADINIKYEGSIYRGDLATESFHLGHLLNFPEKIQKIDMKGQISGTGFLLDEADFVLNANISRFGILGYDYVNIEIDSSRLRKQSFEGKMRIKDPNLRMGIDGRINFQDSTFNFIAQIDTAYFDRLGFVSQPLFVCTKVNANFVGLDPKIIEGGVQLTHNNFRYKEKLLVLDTFFVITSLKAASKSRTVRLRSEPIDLDVIGAFDFKSLFQNTQSLFEAFMADVRPNDSIKVAYFVQQAQNPTVVFDQYGLKVVGKMRNFNKILALVTDDIKIAYGAKMSATLNFGENSHINFALAADTLYIADQQFIGNEINVYLNKDASNTAFDTEVRLVSREQTFGSLKTRKLALTSYRVEDHFIINGYAEHQQSGDWVNLNAYVSNYADRTEIDFPQTTFQFLDKQWKNVGATKNKLIIKGNRLEIREIQFASGDQKISLAGFISKNPADSLAVRIQHFDLNILSTYLEKKLAGSLNLTANIRDMYNNMVLESNIQTTPLKVNTFLLGSLKGKSIWEEDSNKLHIDLGLRRQEIQVIQLSGDYKPGGQDEQLALQVFFNGFNLNVIAPFLTEGISIIDGMTIGYLDVKGELKNPKFSGDVLIHDGKFKIDYLNTYYKFTDKIYFTQQGILVKNMKLIDTNNNQAFITGGYYHNTARPAAFTLSGVFEDFMILNTTAKMNPSYYGTAIGSGNFDIRITDEGMNIRSDARTEKGTKIFIPLGGETLLEDKSYITFIATDSTSSDSLTATAGTSAGLQMALNLEITPDAYGEIIFNKKSGDIIRGNAEGKLKMLVDANGDFNMFGRITLAKGAYNFTLAGLVDKRFDILPNSSINWSGDPHAGLLDLRAQYRQTTSLAPIINLDNGLSLNKSDINKQYPVNVLLHLRQNLLAPSLNFDIQIEEYPKTILVDGVPIAVESYISAFHQRLKNDEQELNRQAFSLIVLKRLSPEQTFVGISQSASNSVSELLTNQLSYWVSQVDDNLEIDLDLDGLNTKALNALQLRLSYTFLNGRLRVTRAGGFTDTQNRCKLCQRIGRSNSRISIRYGG